MDRTRARYRERLKKSRRSGVSAANAKLTVFAALILLACALRFSSHPALVSLRGSVAGVLRADSDYIGAVEVLGRAVSGQAEENAIAVFGRKILGFDGRTEPPETEPPETAEPTQGKTSAPATGEPGARAGAVSGLAFSGFEYSCESVPPPAMQAIFLPSELDLDELDDTAPDELLEIPIPDAVDDTVYELPFKFTEPAQERVSSAFGYRTLSSNGETAFHHGVDVAVAEGTKVVAFADGVVSYAGYSGVYGNYVRIDHADGFSSMYAHLKKITVKNGAKVKLGEKIGESGSTGNVTGAHLHFELRKDGNIINPQNYLWQE